LISGLNGAAPVAWSRPTIEKISKVFKDRILAVKINVDKKKHLAARYQITGIPTIIIFHRGQILMRQSGAMPYEMLKSEIEKLLMTI